MHIFKLTEKLTFLETYSKMDCNKNVQLNVQILKLENIVRNNLKIIVLSDLETNLWLSEKLLLKFPKLFSSLIQIDFNQIDLKENENDC